MRLEIHRVFRIGMLAYITCAMLMTYLSADRCATSQSPSCTIDMLVSDDQSCHGSSETPFKSNNQNAPEVEEDDDDSAREWFSYVCYDESESDFPEQSVSLDYHPVQGEISTPPPRG